MEQKINYFIKNFLTSKFSCHINILDIINRVNVEVNLSKKSVNLFFEKELDREIFKHNCVELLKSHLSDNNLEYDLELIVKLSNNEILSPKSLKTKENFLSKFTVPNDKTFKNFILADFNKKAIETINFALKNKSANKIFIYSKSGLGKSHLLYAIYNDNKRKSAYISIPVLVRLFSKLKNDFSEFLNNLSKYEILLIDDLQFLDKDYEINNSFFAVLDIFLLSQTKKIFIVSDTPINLLINLEHRILTRLESFMNIEIEEPTPKSIMKIINYKIKNNLSGYKISDDAIEYIAANFYENIRKIDGIFTTIIFNLINKNVDAINIEFLESILNKNIIHNKKIDYIYAVEEVSKYLNVSEYELLSAKNDKKINYGVLLIFYILYNIYGYSYNEINNIFPNKNIKVIKSGINKINKELFKEKKLQKFIDIFKYKFYKKTNN